MAFVKFDRGTFRNGNKATGLNYGQIEPNQVWFDRDGMVEAQSRLDVTQFSDAQESPTAVYTVDTSGASPVVTQKIVAQVGAFLMVDKANYRLQIPTYAGVVTGGFAVGINYSTERIYDDTAKQRRKFFLTTNDWLPRIGYVERGMRITTNTVQFDPTATINGVAFTSLTTGDSYTVWQAVRDQIKAGGNPIYAAVRDDSDGELVIGITPDSTKDIVLAQVVAAYDNADRTCSFMFQIIDGQTK